MMSFPDNLYGESLFTTTRLTSRGLFYKKEHFFRLKSGVEEYYLERVMNQEEESQFENRLIELYQDLDRECVIRLKVSLGQREDLLPSKVGLSDLCFSSSQRSFSLNYPLSLKMYPSPFTLDYPDMKMGSYMPHFHFKRKAKNEGYDDALFFLDNTILSSTTSNIFFLKEGQIITSRGKILSGVIRKILIDKMGARQEDIPLDSMSNYEGAFVTNSSHIIQEVKTIDNIIFTKNNDKIIDELKNKLEEFGYE